MKIEYNVEKRRLTLEKRNLDFEDAPKVFASDHFDLPADVATSDEVRYLTFGWLEDRAVVIVWTPRGNAHRIISMRHIHAKELETRRRALD